MVAKMQVRHQACWSPCMPVELAQVKILHAAVIDMHIMFRMVLLQPRSRAPLVTLLQKPTMRKFGSRA